MGSDDLVSPKDPGPASRSRPFFLPQKENPRQTISFGGHWTEPGAPAPENLRRGRFRLGHYVNETLH
jgi:hypothetical protein